MRVKACCTSAATLATHHGPEPEAPPERPRHLGIAAPDHPIIRLADQLGDNNSAQDNEHLMLQALLLCALS
jgi:hypothetical protein